MEIMQSVERQLEARAQALRQLIERNFSKTREVERELLLLRRDMDLTSGSRQGRTLVHFLAQLEHLLWDWGCASGLFWGCLGGLRGYWGCAGRDFVSDSA